MASYEQELNKSYKAYYDSVEQFLENASKGLISLYQQAVSDSNVDMKRREAAEVLVKHIKDNFNKKTPYLVHVDYATYSWAITNSLQYFNLAEMIRKIYEKIATNKLTVVSVNDIELEIERLYELRSHVCAEDLLCRQEGSGFKLAQCLLHNYQRINVIFDQLYDCVRLPSGQQKRFESLKQKGSLGSFRTSYPERLITYFGRCREKFTPDQQSQLLKCIKKYQFRRLDLSVFGITVTDKIVESILQEQKGNLQSLILSGTAVTDGVLSIIAARAARLERLILRDVESLQLNMSSPVKLPKLRVLDISGCPNLTGFFLLVPNLIDLYIGWSVHVVDADAQQGYFQALTYFLQNWRNNNELGCWLYTNRMVRTDEIETVFNYIYDNPKLVSIRSFNNTEWPEHEYQCKLRFKDALQGSLGISYTMDCVPTLLQYCNKVEVLAKTKWYEQKYYRLMQNKRFYILLDVCQSAVVSHNAKVQTELIAALRQFLNATGVVGNHIIVTLFMALVELHADIARQFIMKAFNAFTGRINSAVISGFIIKLYTYHPRSAFADDCMVLLEAVAKSDSGNYDTLVKTILLLVRSDNQQTKHQGRLLIKKYLDGVLLESTGRRAATIKPSLTTLKVAWNLLLSLQQSYLESRLITSFKACLGYDCLQNEVAKQLLEWLDKGDQGFCQFAEKYIDQCLADLTANHNGLLTNLMVEGLNYAQPVIVAYRKRIMAINDSGLAQKVCQHLGNNVCDRNHSQVKQILLSYLRSTSSEIKCPAEQFFANLFLSGNSLVQLACVDIVTSLSNDKIKIKCNSVAYLSSNIAVNEFIDYLQVHDAIKCFVFGDGVGAIVVPNLHKITVMQHHCGEQTQIIPDVKTNGLSDLEKLYKRLVKVLNITDKWQQTVRAQIINGTKLYIVENDKFICALIKYNTAKTIIPSIKIGDGNVMLLSNMRLKYFGQEVFAYLQTLAANDQITLDCSQLGGADADPLPAYWYQQLIDFITDRSGVSLQGLRSDNKQFFNEYLKEFAKSLSVGGVPSDKNRRLVELPRICFQLNKYDDVIHYIYNQFDGNINDPGARQWRDANLIVRMLWHSDATREALSRFVSASSANFHYAMGGVHKALLAKISKNTASDINSLSVALNKLSPVRFKDAMAAIYVMYAQCWPKFTRYAKDDVVKVLCGIKPEWCKTEVGLAGVFFELGNMLALEGYHASARQVLDVGFNLQPNLTWGHDYINGKVKRLTTVQSSKYESTSQTISSTYFRRGAKYLTMYDTMVFLQWMWRDVKTYNSFFFFGKYIVEQDPWEIINNRELLLLLSSHMMAYACLIYTKSNNANNQDDRHKQVMYRRRYEYYAGRNYYAGLMHYFVGPCLISGGKCDIKLSIDQRKQLTVLYNRKAATVKDRFYGVLGLSIIDPDGAYLESYRRFTAVDVDNNLERLKWAAYLCNIKKDSERQLLLYRKLSEQMSRPRGLLYGAWQLLSRQAAPEKQFTSRMFAAQKALNSTRGARRDPGMRSGLICLLLGLLIVIVGYNALGYIAVNQDKVEDVNPSLSESLGLGDGLI